MGHGIISPIEKKKKSQRKDRRGDVSNVKSFIDPNQAFRICVLFSQFTTMHNDGQAVDVSWKYDEWEVNFITVTRWKCYKMTWQLGWN